MTAQYWPSHVVMEVRGASKTYLSGANTVTALADMSLALRAGELTGIVGKPGGERCAL